MRAPDRHSATAAALGIPGPPVCRVCGVDAVVGCRDGWYCAATECLDQRTVGRNVNPLRARVPGAYCAPNRCYCGLVGCPAIATYRFLLVHPTVAAVEDEPWAEPEGTRAREWQDRIASMSTNPAHQKHVTTRPPEGFRGWVERGE